MRRSGRNTFATRLGHREGRVKSEDIQVSADEIVRVLSSLRLKGVSLWVENGQLHYKAPKQALTSADIEKLRVVRPRIISLLESATEVVVNEPRRECRSQPDCIPLAYSQLAHWNLYRLSERRAIRQVASATRLHGRLNVRALQKSVMEIVHRHDALRARIFCLDGIPVQKIAKSRDIELEIVDLTALSDETREAEIRRLIDQLILEPIDTSVDPLFGSRLLKCHETDHVLVLAMEHMISDEFSMRILLEDLFLAYERAVTGKTIFLPEIQVTFAEFAVWQRETQQAWVAKHGAYWAHHFAGCGRVSFPEAPKAQTVPGPGWGTVPISIPKQFRAELWEWCRRRRTTLVMSVLTAYVGLVLRWCKAPESVIQYESDGRVSPSIERTVGYFASALYLRIALRNDDRFVDLLHRVQEEFCRAHEHADLSYMAAQLPQPEFTRNTAFNWVPYGSRIDMGVLRGSDEEIVCELLHFPHPILRSLDLDHEPTILLFDVEDEVVGGVYFPLNRFSEALMEKFAQNVILFLRALMTQSEERVSAIPLL
jgi:hypothetical protein